MFAILVSLCVGNVLFHVFFERHQIFWSLWRILRLLASNLLSFPWISDTTVVPDASTAPLQALPGTFYHSVAVTNKQKLQLIITTFCIAALFNMHQPCREHRSQCDPTKMNINTKTTGKVLFGNHHNIALTMGIKVFILPCSDSV